jgi:hypothetical protein
MVVKSKNVDDNVDFEKLGIAGAQELDRMQLDERGAMSITRIRFDTKTKYDTPITKIDGFDIATGERVKYFTLSKVIYQQMNDIIKAVGATLQIDENNNEWNILNKGVNIKGFEKVSTGVRGQNPYLKIKTVTS